QILRSQTSQPMPLLAPPFAVTWSAGAPSSSAVIGLRTYNGEGYLMLVNPTGSSLTITFTPSGLGYSPASVIDFFSGATITAISGGSFTITLAANQTAVYRLAKPAAAPTIAISAVAAPLPLSPTANSDNYVANSGFIAPTTNTASPAQLASASAPPKSTSPIHRRARRKPKSWETTIDGLDFITAISSLTD